MSEYAMSDERIRLVRYANNQKVDLQAFLAEHATGEYFAVLDSDDWWEPDYLERLLFWSETNELDVACTGTVMHILKTGEQCLRKATGPMVFSRETLAEGLPLYHVFFRTLWGKLIRIQCMCAVPEDSVPKFSYGRDTAWCFQLLRQAKKVGVDSSLLHHYRIHEKSASYQYNPQRFDADVYLYNDAIDFLTSFGPVSAKNRDFLQTVYANAVTDTIGVIYNSGLSPAEKLREYRRIAENPITRAAYRECTDEGAGRSRTLLLQSALEAGAALNGQDNENFRAVIQQLLPRCGRAVTGKNAALFFETPELLKALLRDDPDTILQDLLNRVEQGRDVKKYAPAEMIQALAADRPLLCQINDTVFLKKYGGIYWSVWQEDTLSALDEMTGLLLENRVRSGRETFLKLYISLSAQLEQAGAFVFGKIRLAEVYFSQNRLAECQSLVGELEEMGLGEQEEVQTLRSKLGDSMS